MQGRSARKGYTNTNMKQLRMTYPYPQRQLELLGEKGSSIWLSTLPLKACGDALSLRYNLPLSIANRTPLCICMWKKSCQLYSNLQNWRLFLKKQLTQGYNCRTLNHCLPKFWNITAASLFLTYSHYLIEQIDKMVQD